jgi:nitrogen PTS system EIIA component
MSASLIDLIGPADVQAAMPARNKKQLFAMLADFAGERIGQPAAAIAEVLLERERLGSTGFGGGIAIPHGKVPRLDQMCGFLVRTEQPVDYKAIDDMPVDIVVMLLSPPDAGADHLKALARVSRAFRDRALVDKLRGAGSTDALFALLAGGETRDAA